MKRTELEHMPLDDLWALHLKISDTLAYKLAAEKRMLEVRLSQLARQPTPDAEARTVERRPYPTVFPKCGAVSDVGGSWQAAALVDGATEVGPSDRRLQDPAGRGVSRSDWSINKKGRPKAAFLVRDLKAFKPTAKRDDWTFCDTP